ncbi:MAG: hypothetical protein U0228_33335 [Myxococcaceae bacterium]
MRSPWLVVVLVMSACTGNVSDPGDGGSGGGTASGGGAATGGGGGGAVGGGSATGGGTAAGGGTSAGGGGAVDPLSTNRDDFFGASRCASAGLAFCDDFESRAAGQPPDPAQWTLQFWNQGLTSLSVDDTQAARGSKSIKIHQELAVNRAVMTHRSTFPLAKFWVRLFFRTRAVPPPMKWDNGCNCLNPGVMHWTYAFAQGATTFGDGVKQPELRAGDFINEGLFVNEDGMGDGRAEVGQGDDANKPAGYDGGLRPNEWQCLEFMWDAPGKELRVFWDGREHPALNVKNKADWAFPDAVFSSLSVGLSHYQTDATLMPGGFDVWIDEVAIDANRIGCAR